MSDIQCRIVDTNGIRMNIAECGAGPLILLCHSFPESWYSWRHQLLALADAGFHAVAPDMRGYGRTDRPDAADAYTIFHLTGDMIGLLDTLNVEQAVIAGHGMGAFVAWHAALFRPDRFRAVIGLSVPYPQRSAVRPTILMPEGDDAEHYLRYFQSGRAEEEFARDVDLTIRTLFHTGSGEVGGQPRDVTMIPQGRGWLSLMLVPGEVPPWLTEADIMFYVEEFTRTGFGGGLNWYRNIDRNWDLLAPFAGAQIKVPALYITGDHDLAVSVVGGTDQIDQITSDMRTFIPQFQRTIILPDCGHSTQQERPDEVSGEMLAFLRALPAPMVA